MLPRAGSFLFITRRHALLLFATGWWSLPGLRDKGPQVSFSPCGPFPSFTGVPSREILRTSPVRRSEKFAKGRATSVSQTLLLEGWLSGPRADARPSRYHLQVERSS
jgi:hypothetical protein